MPETTETDLLKTAFAVIEEQGWHGFSRAEVARRAGVPLARVYAELPTRHAVLAALGRRLDETMLGMEPSELADLTPRERVFELIMRRLDAMAPFKGGLRVLGREAGARCRRAGLQPVQCRPCSGLAGRRVRRPARLLTSRWRRPRAGPGLRQGRQCLAARRHGGSEPDPGRARQAPGPGGERRPLDRVARPP